MKKIFSLVTLFFLVILSASAQQNQAKVNSSGVLLGSGAAQADYNIMLTNTGSNINGTYVRNNTAVTSANWSQSLTLWQKIGINKDVGLRVNAYSVSALSRARSFGVYATSGNATSGYNYGLYGDLFGSNNGTALYASHSQGLNDYINGKYAGYFNGKVYVSERLGIGYTSPSYALDVAGTIRATTITTTSDSRLKTNIADLGNSFDKIGKLRAVTYNFKPDDYAEQRELLQKSAVSDTGKVVINSDADLRKYFALDEKRDDGRKHIGFVAQEFKDVFPELVYEDEKGMLSIDYVSLIPVLVETIQTLNARVEALENEKESLSNGSQGGGADNFLFTIFPNPTNGELTVNYQLFIDAPVSMELYNLYGQRIKSLLPNQNKTAGNYTLRASVAGLTSGTYLVKVTSGSQIESKQLIINP